uniref:Uncharacterized protein n=1 Tax=Anopheles maculatus TaxID=74869 RepID=A0A182SIK4_9DIPT
MFGHCTCTVIDPAPPCRCRNTPSSIRLSSSLHLVNLVNLGLERNVCTGRPGSRFHARCVTVPRDTIVLARFFLAQLFTDSRFLVTDTEDIGTPFGQLLQTGLDCSTRRVHIFLGHLLDVLVPLFDPARIKQTNAHMFGHLGRRNLFTRNGRNEIIVRRGRDRFLHLLRLLRIVLLHNDLVVRRWGNWGRQ